MRTFFLCRVKPGNRMLILFTISSALSIIITSVVGAVFFREKLTLRNICGIALGIGAVLIINFL